MIGEGILMAYKELDMEKMGIPLVVRLRGTNEEIGQKLVSLCVSCMKCYTNENRSRRAGCPCWRFTSLMVRWRR
jgi:succinyl-CoA synthetase beta subunit